MSVQSRQLLVFGFGTARAAFEGRIGGALERAESGGAVRIVYALFAGRDAAGTLHALCLPGSGRFVESLLSFRLDRERRTEVTPDLAPFAAELAGGTAVVAVLMEHVWLTVLADAVDRSGGRQLADEFGLFLPATREDFARQVLDVTRRERETLREIRGTSEVRPLA